MLAAADGDRLLESGGLVDVEDAARSAHVGSGLHDDGLAPGDEVAGLVELEDARRRDPEEPALGLRPHLVERDVEGLGRRNHRLRHPVLAEELDDLGRERHDHVGLDLGDEPEEVLRERRRRDRRIRAVVVEVAGAQRRSHGPGVAADHLETRGGEVPHHGAPGRMDHVRHEHSRARAPLPVLSGALGHHRSQ